MTATNPPNLNQSVDQLALEALGADQNGDIARRDALLRQSGLPEHIIRLIWAAVNEDMISLPDLLGNNAADNSAYHLARATWLTKERVPDRHLRLPHIEDDLRASAALHPPLLLAKLRWLHRVMVGAGSDNAQQLLNEILTFPLAARDAEQLAVILHSGGQTSSAIALLSRMLQQITDAADHAVVTEALAWLLERDNKAPMAQQLRAMVQSQPHPLLSQWSAPLPTTLPASNGDMATIIIPTNLSPKFVYNQASAPPSDKMIRQTLDSLYDQLQCPRGPNGRWPVLIYFDEPRDPALASQADEYRSRLEQVASDYGAQLHCRPGLGLRRNFIDAMEKTTTPYYMLLEHDWTFAPHSPPLPLLMQTLQAHPDLNVIRYNYNFNHLQRHDFALIPYATQTGLPLMTGAYYCNNPALVRTAKMKRDWLPLTMGDKYDTHNAGAGGIEEAVYAQMMKLIRDCGVLPVAQAMGCGVIGRPGDANRAIHNGI